MSVTQVMVVTMEYELTAGHMVKGLRMMFMIVC